jgi:hypothetical protein
LTAAADRLFLVADAMHTLLRVFATLGIYRTDAGIAAWAPLYPKPELRVFC